MTSLSEQKFLRHYCGDQLLLTWALSDFLFSLEDFHFAISEQFKCESSLCHPTDSNSFCFKEVKSFLNDQKLNICDLLKAVAVYKTVTENFFPKK